MILRNSIFVVPSLFLSTFITISNTVIIIESPKFTNPVEYECDKVNFDQENYVTCLCLEGIWALSISRVNHPSIWKILGGHSEYKVNSTSKIKFKPKCYHIGEWVSKLQRISHITTKPSVRKLKPNANKFLVTNKEDWEVKVHDLSGNEERKLCLAGHGLTSYCIYDLNRIQKSFEVEVGPIKEDAFTAGCSTESIILKAEECGTMFPKDESLDEYYSSWPSCSLIPIKNGKIRVKRADTAAGDPPKASDNSLLDEDYVDPEKSKLQMGHPDMMSSVVEYVKLAVAQRLEASDIGKQKIRKKPHARTLSPVQDLLRICKDISQKSCSAVSGDTFEIALNSFLTQQINRNHWKEAYIAYPIFERTLQALERCRAEARPFMFFPNGTDNYCDSQLPDFTSTIIKRMGQNVTIPEMPMYAKGDTSKYDPIIEVVWKMFLTAHSFCFKFFSDYFNDHHSFTIAMIPLFTNKIQDIWMLTGNGSSSGNGDANSTTSTNGTIWYGNLLGDATTLMGDIDHCYQAARVPLGPNPSEYYPWFMKRPPRDPTNEWLQRRKRSAHMTDFESSAEPGFENQVNMVRPRGSCEGNLFRSIT